MSNIRIPLVALLAATLLATLIQSAQAETLKVGGTGSATPLVELLFKEFRKQTPGAELEQTHPPLGSGGALRALAGGRLDLAFIGRPLNPEETARLGRHFALAQTPFILASLDGKKSNGFSFDELARVYAGQLPRWEDGVPIRLVLRASTESDTLALKAMSPGIVQAVDAAGQRPGMALGQDDLDTLALLSKTAGSLGPSTLGLLSSTGTRLQVYPINGVQPSIAAMKSGRYPWHKTMIVALPKQPSALAERFTAFLRSDPARALLLRHDYLAVEP